MYATVILIRLIFIRNTDRNLKSCLGPLVMLPEYTSRKKAHRDQGGYINSIFFHLHSLNVLMNSYNKNMPYPVSC